MLSINRPSKKMMIVLSILVIASLALSGCVALRIFRMPSSITKGTSSSQWFGRVVPQEGSAEGLAFQYIVWLHIPEDWSVPWGTQWSFTGDFNSVSMSKDFASLTWISGDSCAAGGAASSGYKWQAFVGPVEQMPAEGDRVNNQVNLRGGITVPSGETSATYSDVRVIFGTRWDADDDTLPDTYSCTAGGTTVIDVP